MTCWRNISFINGCPMWYIRKSWSPSTFTQLYLVWWPFGSTLHAQNSQKCLNDFCFLNFSLSSFIFCTWKLNNSHRFHLLCQYVALVSPFEQRNAIFPSCFIYRVQKSAISLYIGPTTPTSFDQISQWLYNVLVKIGWIQIVWKISMSFRY